jgi:hypothetical protein
MDWIKAKKKVVITLGETILRSTDEKTEAGTGYFKRTIPGNEVKPSMANINVTIGSGKQLSKQVATSWGSVYLQYFEDIDKITPSATPIEIEQKAICRKEYARRTCVTGC